MFRPAARCRVSFVWWDRGPDEDASPIFTERDGHALTLIAAWPMLANGEVDVGRLSAVRVLAWEMTDATFARIEALHRSFDVGRSDLVVWAAGDRLLAVPSLDRSIYRAVLASERDEAAVVAAIIDRERADILPAVYLPDAPSAASAAMSKSNFSSRATRSCGEGRQ